MALATGQITIIDLNDSVTLQGYLTSSQPKMQFRSTAGGYTPSWTTSAPVTVSAELYKMGSADNLIANTTLVTGIRWYYKKSVTAEAEITSTTAGFTIAANRTSISITDNLMTQANPGLQIRCEIDYKHSSALPVMTYKMDIDFTLTQQGATGNAGADAYTVFLSNEAQTFPAANNGNIAADITTTSTVMAYKGATAQTPTIGTLPTITGLALSASGAVITIVAKAGTALAANGSFDIPITVDGKSFTKTFTWSKSLTGAAGNDSTSYWVTSSDSVIKKAQTGTISPTSITFTAMSKVGNGAPANYAGRFKIYEDGTLKYTSSANEATKTYSPSASTKLVKAEVYLAGGTTTLVDSQTVPIVFDGIDGTEPITCYVWAPSGSLFKNVLTNEALTIEFKLFKGNADKTDSATNITWAYQDSAAAGGWATIATTTGKYTISADKKTLTVYADAVDSMKVFKCSATYGGQTVSDTIVFQDQTDPYQIHITSTAGNVFKNGVGTTTLACKVWQNGSEIDTDGTAFSYNWSKYDKSGTKVTYSATTKTITVSAADVDEKATYFCEISRK